MNTLTDKTCVVTGAAGGIGRALALELGRRGARLALVDLDPDALDAVAAELSVPVSVHAVSVADRAAMLALPAQVLAHHPSVDVLINNAGITVYGSFQEHTLDDWDRVLNVNLMGVVHGVHAFLPHLLQRPQAHIVNLSSIFGVVGVPNQSAYCASKFGVRGLSEALWEELAHTNVGLTVVHPGGVRTGIMANSKAADPEEKAHMVHVFKKVMRAETAATEIVDAVLAGQPRLLVTREARVFDWLKRMAPVAGNRRAVAMIIQGMGLEKFAAKRRGDQT